jgi:hypothetical protein
MVEWYLNKGYECNLRDEIWVRAKDLQHQSEKYIFVKCDYCGKIIERQFCIYIRGHKIIYKDCCDDCAKYKRDESMTKLYGTSNPMKVKDFVLKAKQTSLNRYGVEYYNQSNEGKERYKNTCQEKYGVDNISKSNYFAEKYKNTMNERYNVDNGFQSEEIKNKIKKTNMEKYGVPNPNQNEEIREKSKQTCIKKYGVDSPFQLEAFKEKIRHTNLKRYGFPYTMQSEEVREKSRETNFKKYGVYNPTQNKEILQKGLCQVEDLRHGRVHGKPVIRHSPGAPRKNVWQDRVGRTGKTARRPVRRSFCTGASAKGCLVEKVILSVTARRKCLTGKPDTYEERAIVSFEA